MKHVLTKPPTQTYVHIENVDHTKYYGVSYSGEQKSSLGQKAFLTRQHYSSGPTGVFMWRCVDGVNRGNGIFSERGYYSVADAIKQCMEFNVEVFEFDTAKELFKWLAQD